MRQKYKFANKDPKKISVARPIFFTPGDANLARVKRILRALAHKDVKVLPVIDNERLDQLISMLLDAIGQHNVKLVSKEFSPVDKFGESWFYGVTKVKENQMVISVGPLGSVYKQTRARREIFPFSASLCRKSFRWFQDSKFSLGKFSCHKKCTGLNFRL